jgi:hypothetical protein
MMGGLADALETLLMQALPGLLGGATPPVLLSINGGEFEVDPQSAESVASEPRADDHTDQLPFDASDPAGPYLLTRPPYPGPRRVRLLTTAGDRITLRASEVVWDEVDARQFTLDLRPDRDLTEIAQVEVLYGVTAVFTKIKTIDTVNVELSASGVATAELARAEALVLAVISLHRQQIADAARETYEDGEYGATTELKGITVLKGSSPADDARLLTLRAEAEVKATRALRADEGRPIIHISTPGRPIDPDRPVDIRIDVDG